MKFSEKLISAGYSSLISAKRSFTELCKAISKILCIYPYIYDDVYVSEA